MARVALCLLIALAACLSLASAKPKPGSLANMDIDEVLKNKRLFESYYKCLMDQGPCSPEGTELKARLPHDMESQCADCSDADKMRAKKALAFVKRERKDVWEALLKKYDPEGKWTGLNEWIDQ